MCLNNQFPPYLVESKICFHLTLKEFLCCSVVSFSIPHVLPQNTRIGYGLFSEIRRSISSGELSSLLRPFYFAVHPDLFGQHPEQRVFVFPS